MQATELVEGPTASQDTYVRFACREFSSATELVGGEVKFDVNSSVCLFLLNFSYINIILSLLSKKRVIGFI